MGVFMGWGCGFGMGEGLRVAWRDGGAVAVVIRIKIRESL